MDDRNQASKSQDSKHTDSTYAIIILSVSKVDGRGGDDINLTSKAVDVKLTEIVEASDSTKEIGNLQTKEYFEYSIRECCVSWFS